MMRLLGALCLLVGAVGLYRLLALRARRRAGIYAGILRLLQYISVEISCFCTAREALFSSFQDEILEKNGFLPALRASGCIPDAIRASEVNIAEADLALLAEFDASLGGSFHEEQLEICAYYVERWREQEGAVRASLPSEIRLTRTVTLSGGMLLFLLLL